MTITEEIRIAGTAEAIAEALMKCGKVKDMAEAFRAVTGEDFYGKIVGVKKDELAYNMGWQIKKHLEFESFKALPFNEKVTELCAKDAYEAGRFLYAFTLAELHEVAEIIGADTSGVNVENEISEKLDYMTAINERLFVLAKTTPLQPKEIAPEVKDERKIESAMPLLRIESEATDEKFKALSVSEKFNELTAVNANVASRYVYMCTSDEVKTIAQMLGVKTGNVFTLVVKALEVREQRVRIERLIELGADERRVRAELQFNGDILKLLARELGITVIERADEKEVINKLIAHYFEKTESVSQEYGSFSDAPGDNSCPEQDIPEPYISEESPDSLRANQRGEKFLQCISISAVKREITAMLNKYAENRALIQVIREGVTEIRKGIKICEKQGLPIDAFEKVIKEAHEKYREIRREGFILRQKLLRAVSASEIRRACKAFMARCEKERRRQQQ